VGARRASTKTAAFVGRVGAVKVMNFVYTCEVARIDWRRPTGLYSMRGALMSRRSGD
jgi:hypothetical protein